jgi:hypothetical protein
MSEQAGYGLLNGQPVGPELPPSVPCEVCGHPVYCTERVVAYRRDKPFDTKRVEVHGVFERTFPLPDQPWALTKHRCRNLPARTSARADA